MERVNGEGGRRGWWRGWVERVGEGISGEGGWRVGGEWVEGVGGEGGWRDEWRVGGWRG